MKHNKIKELELFEAKRETDIDYFFCKMRLEFGEKGSCGKDCDEYIPNNGVSGRCFAYGYCYERTDKKIIVKNKIKKINC